MRLGYALAIIHFGSLLVLGVYTWPSPLCGFHWMKYIDFIAVWDLHDVARLVDGVRTTAGRPATLREFSALATTVHYASVVVAGTLQWFVIGVILGRLTPPGKLLPPTNGG